MRYLLPLLLTACAWSLPPSVVEATRPSVLLATPIRDGLKIETAPVGLAAAVLPVTVTGTIRFLLAPAACRPVHGVNPFPVLPREIPRVGREVAVTWATRACTLPPPPPAACWLVVSYRDPVPVDFSPFGAPGCWLMAALDQVVAVPTQTGSLVWRDGGYVLFRWTPPAWAAGTRMILQLLVSAPGENAAGWLVSPAVELIVGSA